MALIKEIELPTGNTGNYWKIVQHNTHFNGGNKTEDVVTLACYKDSSAKVSGKYPTQVSIQFIFSELDYPFSDFNPEPVDLSVVNTIRDLRLHMLYLHIKNIITAAQLKDISNLTENESKSLILVGAVDG